MRKRKFRISNLDFALGILNFYKKIPYLGKPRQGGKFTRFRAPQSPAGNSRGRFRQFRRFGDS